MKKIRKLRLDPDALRIDSFATDAADHARGTVRGHDSVVQFPGDTYSFAPDCQCPFETNPLYDCTYGCNTVNEPECGLAPL